MFGIIHSQSTYRDEFQSISYNINDGNSNWSGPWIETNDNNSPLGGTIFVNNNRLEFNDTNNGQNIRRTANLNGASNATLTFEWEAFGLDQGNGFREELGIFVSDNPNNGFVNIGNGTIIGDNNGFFTSTIPVAQISNQTTIAFAIIGGGNNSFEVNEFVTVDNLQIITNTELISISDETANESDDTITFTVTRITPPALGASPFTVDFNTNNESALEPLDYIAQNGTLNFSASDTTQTITITINDNPFLTTDRSFLIELSNAVGSNIVISDNQGIGTIIEDPTDNPVPLNTPLSLFERFNGLFDYSTTGDSFRIPSNVNECNIAATRPGVTLTSQVPPTARVRSAYLFWAHSGFNPDNEVTFEGQNVTASIVNGSFIGNSPSYGMVADVTNIIQNIPIVDLSTNLFEMEDLNINNGSPFCEGTVVFGGWSLMVFYTEPSLPASSIVLFNGFDGRQNDSESYTLDGFFAIGNANAKTSTLSWEGDVGLANNELLSITTSSGTTTVLNGDGDNNGTINNPFNSTVFDNTNSSNIINRTTLGLDLDTFDISSAIAQGETSATTNVNVGQDFVISNAVLLKVPSNLMVGNIFEDINFPGGEGRNFSNSNGIPIPNVLVEIYRELPDGTFVFDDSTLTDSSGEFVLGGMPNGTYRLRVVTSTITSSRNGNSICTPNPCNPVQTFETGFNGINLTPNGNKVGGQNPEATTDTNAGIILGAQSFTTVTIENEGVVDLNFGFNFNTIVNTNPQGQGSLEQFIINSNNLDETGLDIDAHPNNANLNPAAGNDTSIFNIPTSDKGFISADGYFDIFLDTGNLTSITSDNTKIDGRTQTAFTGDTNTGTVGAGGSTVGTNADILPNYELPEVQIRNGNSGNYALQIMADNVSVRNLALSGNNNNYDALRIASGTNVILEGNLLNTTANAANLATGNRHGIRVNGGESIIRGNYIANSRQNGIRINGGANSVLIEDNHITNNGINSCGLGIDAIGGAENIIIQNNLLENNGNFGILNGNSLNMIINQNTIANTGALSNNCPEKAGIGLVSSNGATVTGNIISENGKSGIIITGNSTSNLISQNSIFNNGIQEASLGIDINYDGVTLNDTNDSDTGPNERANFPIIETASIRNNQLKITGWSRPNAIIEIFISDISAGTALPGDNQIGANINNDYGEGQIYIATITEGISDIDNTVSSYLDIDGNNDNTNRFNITVNIPNILSINNLITTTSTDPNSNSTSEFSPIFKVGQATVITNRRITYRSK